MNFPKNFIAVPIFFRHSLRFIYLCKNVYNHIYILIYFLFFFVFSSSLSTLGFLFPQMLRQSFIITVHQFYLWFIPIRNEAESLFLKKYDRAHLLLESTGKLNTPIVYKFNMHTITNITSFTDGVIDFTYK